MIKAWVDGSTAKVRVGLESAGHSIFSPDGMEVFSDSETSVAEFGGNGARVGAEGRKHLDVDSDGFGFYSGAKKLGSIDAVTYSSYPAWWGSPTTRGSGRAARAATR